jgi:glutathione peroxidase
MKNLFSGCLAIAMLTAAVWSVSMTTAAESTESVLGFTVKSLAGKDVDLQQYKGKVVLVVNVASQCGYTPQYKDLQALHEKYKEKGLVVAGFPCNQFGAQEPGNAGDIQSFCQKNYGVTFDMFDKIDVNGANANPFYKALKDGVKPTADIKWNFEKFLISKDGKVVARYGSGAKPMGSELVAAVEAELAK